MYPAPASKTVELPGQKEVLPLIAFCVNAPIANLQVDVAFERDAEAGRREFFQRFMLDDRLTPISPRVVPTDGTTAFVTAIDAIPLSARTSLLQTIAQYYFALQNWVPGRESFVLAHSESAGNRREKTRICG